MDKARWSGLCTVSSQHPAPGAWIESKDGQALTVGSLTNEILLGCRKPLYVRDKRSSANPGVLVEGEKE